jgi:hypothetical protein
MLGIRWTGLATFFYPATPAAFLHLGRGVIEAATDNEVAMASTNDPFSLKG